MYPAIFLDRDGVIIKNRSKYVRTWDDVEFYDDAIKILSRFAFSPYRIVVVTNQSAVGRGIISIKAAVEINRKIVLELEKHGCRIDDVFMCPHSPIENCNCRKPRPGMLLQAAEKLSIDLSSSVMIGDAWTDLLAGQAAGVANVILVLTGRGQKQLELHKPSELASLSIHNNLSEALEYLFLGS